VRGAAPSGIVLGMRSSLRCMALLVAVASLHAQDAWAPVAKAVAALRSPESYVLVAALPAPEFAWFGEDSLGSEYEKGIAFLVPSGELGAVMAGIQKGPGWALYEPSGLQIAEGPGLPSPARIRALMEGNGWRSQWDALKDHLRDHPEDAQGWQELVQGHSVHAYNARQAGKLGPGLLGALRTELASALKGFEASLGEGEEPSAQSAIYTLGQAGLDQDPELGPAVRRFTSRIRPLLLRDPENLRLWNMGINLTPASDPAPGALAAALELPGVPGRPWPPPFAPFFLRLIHRDAPAILAREAAANLEANLDPAIVRRLGRRHVNQMLVEWGGLHLEALLRQGHLDEALADAASLRARSGTAWRALSARALLATTRNSPEFPPLPPLTPAQRSPLLDLLNLPPLPDPPLPELPPLRLALLGPHVPIAWARVQIDPLFKVWDPGDLTWTPLSAGEARALKASHAWAAGPRWVLLQGNRLLATGPGLPAAETLDAALRAQATPRLDALNTFIKANPERLDARRERMETLRTRLPDPALEVLFLGDCVATCAPLQALPFKPDPATWGPAAMKICSTLAERLRAWPSNPLAWRAYAQWSALDSRIPRPHELLATLEPWPRMGGHGLAGPVPGPVSFAMGLTLATSGRNREIDAWMQALWSRGLRGFLVRWAGLSTAGGKTRSDFETQGMQVPELLAGWGKAIRAAGDAKRLASVRFDLEEIRPGLGDLLGPGE